MLTTTNERLIFEKEIFTYNVMNKEYPHQGWKIHISINLKKYKEVLFIVKSYCVNNDISFKFMSNKDIIQATFSKESDMSLTGKVITIYPLNKEEFIKIIQELYPLLCMYKGPYIVTDKQYKNSVIYYRYGVINPKNNDLYTLYNDGNLYNDRENLYYTCPPFVTDPFEVEEVKTDSFLLNNQYLIIDSLHFSNFGGIYLARDKKNNHEVVIKEARPHLGYSENETAIKIRKNEGTIIQNLRHLKCFPKFKASFFCEKTFFLVVEKIEGITLRELLNTYSPTLYPLNEISTLKIIYENLNTVLLHLIKLVNDVHQEGYVLQDINLDNFMIRDNFDVIFIDLETVKNASSRKGVTLKNPWSNHSLYYQDNIKLLLLILEVLCPPTAEIFKYNQNFSQLKNIIDHFFVVYSVPNNIKIQIERLITKLSIIQKQDTMLMPNIADDILALTDFLCDKDELDGSWVREVASYKEALKYLNYYKKSNRVRDKQRLVDVYIDYIKQYHTIANYGLKEGMLGLAYLTIELSKIDNDNKFDYLIVVKEIIMHVIGEKSIENGIYVIPVNSKREMYSPYVENGTGGLVKVILKYLDTHYDIELEKELLNIFSNYDISFTRNVDYRCGLFGIMDCYLDMFNYTKGNKYLNRARQLYKTLNLFKINYEGFNIYPAHSYNKELTTMIQDNLLISKTLEKLQCSLKGEMK